MSKPPVLLWDVRLADADRPADGSRWSLEVTDDVITAVTPLEGREAPSGAIDLAGATVIPGLIDAHMHVISSETTRNPGFGPPPALKGAEPRPRELGYFILAAMARATLAAGFTTVRDVGSDDLEGVVLRQAVDLGLTPGPQVLSCGRILSATAPGAVLFEPMYRQADGADELRKAVREQIRNGADFIKIMATGARSVERENPEPAQMTRTEIATVVEETHRLGLRVAAHAEGLEGTRFAVEEGVDTIEHGLSLHRAPSLLDRMAEQGQVLVPTLSTFHDLADRLADAFAPPLVAQARVQVEEAYATVEAARKAGVHIAVGHDSGPPGDQSIEILRLADAGLTNREALTAATASAATALGFADRGLIEVGRRADLVVLPRNPLDDLSVLRETEQIEMVIKAGEIVHQKAGTPARAVDIGG